MRLLRLLWAVFWPSVRAFLVRVPHVVHSAGLMPPGQTEMLTGVSAACRLCCVWCCAGENSGEAQAAAEAAQEASRKAAIAAGLLPEGVTNGGAAAEGEEAARIRRLKAQGRFMPY